ncbi:capsule assembly Wzi family protein [Zunongwangia sp.]|uniref:capsule assembly Wzi family protein n=1 Tax=Zunongwangia sp. TaxID=1965325 RepID=UPI003AA7AB8E
MRKFLLLVITILFITFETCFSQNEAEFNLDLKFGALSNGEDALPFWQSANTYGRITRNTAAYGLVSSSYRFAIADSSSIKFKGAAFFRDKDDSNIFIDELYASWSNSFLEVNVGVKHDDLFYNGLSSSNRSILWSNNARSVPGISIKTTKPLYLFFNKHLGFEGRFSEYLLNDERLVENTRVHHKYLALVYKFSKNSHFKVGVRHIAEYGGKSNDPAIGDQPTGLSDYVKVFFGRAGGDNALETDQLNAIGNHIGSYELSYNRFIGETELEVFYNSIFEDGSGSAMRNFPDGRYGVFYDNHKKDQLVSSFVYEFIYTKNQSQTAPHLWDSYFRHGIYQSGWTYQQSTIGIPFITPTYLSDFAKGFITIGNNRLIAHHLGVMGKLFFPYTMKLSYRRNYGFNQNTAYLKYKHYDPDDERSSYKIASEVISTYLDVQLLNTFISLNLNVAADFTSDNSNFAAGLSVSKSFF